MKAQSENSGSTSRENQKAAGGKSMKSPKKTTSVKKEDMGLTGSVDLTNTSGAQQIEKIELHDREAR